MTDNSLPGSRGPRPAALRLLALCAAAGLVLPACSSGGAPAGASSRHQHSAAASPSRAPSQPSSGPAAISAVRETWTTFFDGGIPIPTRLKLLQDGPQFASFVSTEEKTSLGALVLQAAAKVTAVTLQPPDKAAVTYTVLLGGKPLAKNLKGTAVYSGGRWLIASSSFCGLIREAFASKKNVIPAVCGG